MSSEDESPVPRRTKASAFAMMADEDDSDASASDGDAPAAPVLAPVKPSKAATPAPAPAPAAKGKAKGKGGKKAAAGDDDELALLEALAAENAAANAAAAAAAAPAAAVAAAGGKKAAKGGKTAPAGPAAEGDDGGEEDGEEGGDAVDAAGDKEKDKKKKKKKAKAAAAAATAGDDGGEEAAAASSPGAGGKAAAGKKPEKISAAARMAQARLAAVQAENERRAREEEALRKAEDERIRKLEEEERIKAEKKAAIKERKRLQKEKEIREGTYMTKKQKEALERQRARLGITAAGAAAASAGGDTDSDEEGTPDAAAAEDAAPSTDAAAAATKKRVAAMYDSRKKKGSTPAAAAASSSVAADESAHAPSPAAATPAPAVDDWEAAADDWETAADAAESSTPAAHEMTVKVKPGTWDAGDEEDATKKAALPTATIVRGVAPPPAAAPAPYIHDLSKPLGERIRESRARRDVRYKAALEMRDPSHLRSPICVVLGHVDTGKTSLLDKIRLTNVQGGEAGGITQQIGASYFPMDRLRTATDKLNKDLHLEYKIPGLLIIDTPGHEQFVNLRSRGASLCDLAVLVIDVMHSLERQTIESIQLLRSRKTPFVVALNKVDRMYGWKANPNMPIRETMALQPDYAVSEFETRTRRVLTELAEQGLNAKLYYENDDFRRNVSIVPTSAHTGEGVPDLLMLIVQLTQQLMSSRLMYTPAVQCTVLEVKTIDGLGTTVDVVLVNGELNEGDTIVACGMDGAIVTQVRALLTPPPLREMRVKADYVHHKRIEAAMGVKIAAPGMERAVAGTSLLVLHPDDEIEDLKKEVMEDFDNIMKGLKREAVGVYVQASTLGSLEALLEYLRNHDPPVPVAQVGIGPLHKKDIVQASIMLEHKREYATILAFDVKVTPEARAAAEDLGVRIFTADIIYHLTDQFDKYLKDTVAAKQAATIADAVFPVIAKILPTAVFNKRDPIVLGVEVLEGKLKVGTPLCVILADDKKVAAAAPAAGSEEASLAAMRTGPNVLRIGRVSGIEHNHTAQTEAVAGGPAVAVKITPEGEAQASVTFGRHFDHTSQLLAHVTRTSIDLLKENFRDEMSKENWKTVVKLKGLLGVI